MINDYFYLGIDKKKYPPLTYDFSQEEIAAKAGINMENAGSATDVAMLHEDLIEVHSFILFLSFIFLSY